MEPYTSGLCIYSRQGYPGKNNSHDVQKLCIYFISNVMCAQIAGLLLLLQKVQDV